MASLINFIEKQEFIPVDDWHVIKEWDEKKKKHVIIGYNVPVEDRIFQHSKGAMILDVSSFYGFNESTSLDYFILSPKRCYNNIDMRDHTTHYMNYFEKFYDDDKELLALYYKIKYMIDYVPSYSKEAFIYDIKRYILSGSMLYKMTRMNRDNYSLSLTGYKRDTSLQYTDRHASIMMLMSLIMNIIIPLLTHFIYTNKLESVNGFLLEVYDIVLHMFDIDIYNKLYETSNSNINRNRQSNTTLWDMQDIRGKNVTTHSLYSVENIILNIMPKYQYCENIIHFNYRSIINNTGYQVTDTTVSHSRVI